jgi:hypothetical protein
VQRECLTKALSGLMGAVELHEVGIQCVEEGALAMHRVRRSLAAGR